MRHRKISTRLGGGALGPGRRLRPPAAILVFLLPATLLCACDLLMAPPAEAPPTFALSFAMAEATQVSGWASAFDKTDRAYVVVVTDPVREIQRDTVVPLVHYPDGARGIVELNTYEAEQGAVIIRAWLHAGSLPLFQADRSTRIEFGGTTQLVMLPLNPIPGYLEADRDSLSMRVGESIQISVALLFETRDTIQSTLPEGGFWVSDNEQVVSVTSTGLAQALSPGQATLLVRWDVWDRFNDQVLVQVF